VWIISYFSRYVIFIYFLPHIYSVMKSWNISNSLFETELSLSLSIIKSTLICYRHYYTKAYDHSLQSSWSKFFLWDHCPINYLYEYELHLWEEHLHFIVNIVIFQHNILGQLNSKASSLRIQVNFWSFKPHRTDTF
jgi:hypothetical protein